MGCQAGLPWLSCARPASDCNTTGGLSALSLSPTGTLRVIDVTTAQLSNDGLAPSPLLPYPPGWTGKTARRRWTETDTPLPGRVFPLQLSPQSTPPPTPLQSAPQYFHMTNDQLSRLKTEIKTPKMMPYILSLPLARLRRWKLTTCDEGQRW